MLSLIKESFHLFLTKIKNSFQYNIIKLSLMYLAAGLIWVYASNTIINSVISKHNLALKITIYKGFFYMFVTSTLLYILINNLKKKIYSTEKQLENSHEELEAYAQQLIAYESELKDKYMQIHEDEKQLSKSKEKNSAIVQAIPDVLFILNYEGVFLGCETNDKSLLLSHKDTFIGKTLFEVIPEEVSKLAYQSLNLLFETGKLQRFEYKLIDNGVEGYYEIRMVKKGETEVLAILRDITITKKLEQRLEYLSYNDQLTGLYNRRFYEDELNRLDVKENFPLTIILGDVNGLKLINDSFGHVVGDNLIKKTALIIKNACRPQDKIIRLGGDEFVILAPKTNSVQAEEIIKNINTLSHKEKIKGLDISISFGYETKRYEDETIQDVFIKAEDYMYKNKILLGSSARRKTIDTIINTLNTQNMREKQHSFRVSELCMLMSTQLGLPERKIQQLKTAGLLHDIGKIAIDENILNKPGALTNAEYKEIKRHSEIGYRILSTVNEMSEIAECVLLHHEKWNGNGYPKGLKGLDIPLGARMIAIADAYDAMTNERSYRKALSKEFAIEELKKNSGIQFDPELVDVFVTKVAN